MKYKILTVVFLAAGIAVSSFFACRAIGAQNKYEASERGRREMYSACAYGDLVRLSEAIDGYRRGEGSAYSVSEAAALFERSLTYSELDGELKRRIFAELAALRRHYGLLAEGGIAGSYDSGWVSAAIEMGGLDAITLPDGNFASHGEDGGTFMPRFAPTERQAARRTSDGFFVFSRNIGEGSSMLEGGAYLFYCRNAYTAVGMYENSIAEALYVPKGADPSGERCSEVEDCERYGQAAKEYLSGMTGGKNADKYATLGIVKCGGIVYVSCRLGDDEPITVGLDAKNFKIYSYTAH